MPALTLLWPPPPLPHLHLQGPSAGDDGSDDSDHSRASSKGGRSSRAGSVDGSEHEGSESNKSYWAGGWLQRFKSWRDRKKAEGAGKPKRVSKVGGQAQAGR